MHRSSYAEESCFERKMVLIENYKEGTCGLLLFQSKTVLQQDIIGSGVLKTLCTLQDSVQCHVTSSLLQMFCPLVQRHVSMVTVSWGRVLMVMPLYSRCEIFVHKRLPLWLHAESLVCVSYCWNSKPPTRFLFFCLTQIPVVPATEEGPVPRPAPVSARGCRLSWSLYSAG